MKNDIRELQLCFCPYGYLDIRAICRIGDQAGLYEGELFDIIEVTRESFGYPDLEDIDPVYCVLDYILQQARNKIEEVTGYDFLNDFSGTGSEICTYGNYLASSYDYSEDARQELKEKVTPYIDTLMDDQWCCYFLGKLKMGAN